MALPEVLVGNIRSATTATPRHQRRNTGRFISVMLVHLVVTGNQAMRLAVKNIVGDTLMLPGAASICPHPCKRGW